MIEPMPAGELHIRPSSDADADWATDVYNETHLDEPRDAAFTRWQWGLEDDDWRDRRYAVELSDEPAGWAMVEHIVWEKNSERFANLDAWLQRRLYARPWLDAVYDFLEREAGDLGASVLTTSARVTEAELLGSLTNRGWEEVGRQRYWHLDLIANRERILAMADVALSQARERGFTILTLADDTSGDLETELFELHDQGRQDVPRVDPYSPLSRPLFLEWLRDPQKHRDRFWIARSRGTLAGMSVLAFPVSGIGPASTAWTGVARDYRGVGLARALKLQTLVQAIQLGTARVRTDNDSANAPILHLNDELGYREAPGHAKLKLTLRN